MRIALGIATLLLACDAGDTISDAPEETDGGTEVTTDAEEADDGDEDGAEPLPEPVDPPWETELDAGALTQAVPHRGGFYVAGYGEGLYGFALEENGASLSWAVPEAPVGSALSIDADGRILVGRAWWIETFETGPTLRHPITSWRIDAYWPGDAEPSGILPGDSENMGVAYPSFGRRADGDVTAVIPWLSGYVEQREVLQIRPGPGGSVGAGHDTLPEALARQEILGITDALGDIQVLWGWVTVAIDGNGNVAWDLDGHVDVAEAAAGRFAMIQGDDVLSVDAEGDVRWRTAATPPEGAWSGSGPMGVTPTADGGAVAFGEADRDPQHLRAWVQTFDPDGTAGPVRVHEGAIADVVLAGGEVWSVGHRYDDGNAVGWVARLTP